ncbi:hypothetical protein V2J09_015674 [Rumex salicifolius]
MMRKREKKIVVAVDESEESMFALSWCLSNLLKLSSSNSSQTPQSSDSESEPESESTTLILLYVKPPPTVYSSLDLTGYLFGSDVVATMEEYAKKLTHSVMTKADETCRKYNCSHIKIEKKVGNGDAKDVICRCVAKVEADILVMGSHNYGFFKRAFLGSISNYCTNHVKCPVVVVKHPDCHAIHS